MQIELSRNSERFGPFRKHSQISVANGRFNTPSSEGNPEASNKEIIPGTLLSMPAPILEISINEGFMVLSINLDQEGSAENIEVIYSDFPIIISEQFANAFRNGRYQPSTQGGHAIPSTILMKVTVGQPQTQANSFGKGK